MTAIGRQNIRNVKYRLGDGTSGWPEEAPFGGIIVTAGAPYIPDPLKQQLADGSRLVIPVGDLSHQVLTVVERAGDGFRQYDICPCIFVPLRGRFGWGE
jgi:protein-L-isoaspartate(D-aspartate) O-methyltransferase